MFASKSERKVHYSIRKFSIGVASVVVASLFLGGVVHATENEGITQVATSSNMAKTEHRKAAKQFDEYIKKMLSEIQLDKRKHTQNFALNLKLSRIKTEYLYGLKEKSEAELPPKIKEELTAAFEQFKKDTNRTKKTVAEAEKKVEEAKKKAKDQKEEDRRNYPTNTYKTLELEIAESDVKVKEAELELLKEEAKSRNEDTIKQAKAKVESEKTEATRLKKIKTDRKKAEEAKRRATEEDKVKEKPAEQPQPAPAPQPEKPTEEPENPAPAPKPEKPADQQAEEDYARRSEEEYNRLTQQQPPKTEKPAQPSTPKTGWKQENGMWYFYNTDGS
ncbi:TPA: RICH domain-containing protein, partial [Streptococcus pneumoniae]